MIQQPLDLGPACRPSPTKSAKKATRQAPKVAPPPVPDPFPSYRQTQATIKELRAQIQQLKKASAEKAALNKDAGNQLAKMQKQLADAQKRQSALAAKNNALESQNRRYMNMVYEQMAGQSGKTAIPADMLGRLIRLAHPDKHGNSTAATEATQWLLKQRKS
jgi:chromosome segregation ATPase